MKTSIVLLALLISSVASAGVCKITTVTKAKYALSFSYGKSEKIVGDLESCIDLAKDKLGKTIPGTITIIPDYNSSELPYNEVTEHKVLRVSYSYYDAMTGIQYKGSLR